MVLRRRRIGACCGAPVSAAGAAAAMLRALGHY
jgi:hypothetical protein